MHNQIVPSSCYQAKGTLSRKLKYLKYTAAYNIYKQLLGSSIVRYQMSFNTKCILTEPLTLEICPDGCPCSHSWQIYKGWRSVSVVVGMGFHGKNIGESVAREREYTNTLKRD